MESCLVTGAVPNQIQHMTCDINSAYKTNCGGKSKKLMFHEMSKLPHFFKHKWNIKQKLLLVGILHGLPIVIFYSSHITPHIVTSLERSHERSHIIANNNAFFIIHIFTLVNKCYFNCHVILDSNKRESYEQGPT